MGGQGGQGITSLEEAFRSDDLEALFRSRSHPARHAKTFPIQSPIVSGYSGSPIFDEDGRLVAVVDGALRNGTVGRQLARPGPPLSAEAPGVGGKVAGRGVALGQGSLEKCRVG